MQDGRACSNNLSSRRFYVLLETSQRPRPHTLSFGGGLSLRNEAVSFFSTKYSLTVLSGRLAVNRWRPLLGNPLDMGGPFS